MWNIRRIPDSWFGFERDLGILLMIKGKRIHRKKIVVMASASLEKIGRRGVTRRQIWTR